MKVIIVQLGRIGDSVLTTPIFRAIAESKPNTEIYVLASRHAASVLQDNPRVKKIYIYQKSPFLLLFLILRLRLQRFDWWVDPKDHRSGESTMLAKLCGAQNSIGYNSGHKGPFSISIPSDKDNFLLHVVERNLQVLDSLDIPFQTNARPELFPDSRLSLLVRNQFPPCNRRTVLINISAGDVSRYWLIEKWGEVAKYCIDRGDRVVVTYKPADLSLAKDLEMLQPGLLRFDSPTIRESIAIMPIIDLLITPDTSVVHIAAAFNVPIIAMFPNIEWNFYKFKPLSEKSIVIQPIGDLSIETIEVSNVIEAISEMV
jgi:heptosyltransferase III